MKLLLVLLFFFSLAVKAVPVKTTIHGELKNGKEKVVRLYGYTNFISMVPVKLACDTADDQGRFSFQLMLEKGEVKPVFFSLERFRSFEFYIEAGKTYTLIFDSLDFSLQDEMYSPLTSAFPPLLIQPSEDSTELNNLIHDLTLRLIRFSVTDFAEIAQMRNLRKMDMFKEKLDSVYSIVKHPFFRTMLDYSYAELLFTARLRNTPSLVNRYFNDQPFQYVHPAFMMLFNVIFDKYIYTSRRIPLRDLELHIVFDRNYNALLDSLGKDTVLKNEVVRDMVLIKNLHQMYFSNFLSRDSIYLMMQEISLKSKFSKHREIAASMLPEMKLHLKKYKAPPLYARKADGEYFSLDSLTGLYTYVFFFATYCRICYPEMVVLNNIRDKYVHDINFVSVSMDVNFLKFYYFMEDNSYPWIFVNFNKNFDIEDLWDVRIYPRAFLIDPQGYIVNDNAPMPSEFLESYFQKILKPPDMQ
jgi:thiol-disulfide isomerase/thioredoxin